MSNKITSFLLLGSFVVLAVGLMNDIVTFEMIGAIALAISVLIIGLMKFVFVNKMKMTDAKGLPLGIPTKKKVLLGTLALFMTIILGGVFGGLLMNIFTKMGMDFKQADSPTGKPMAVATMLIVIILLFGVVTFYYNLEYYLKTPDTMWIIASSFLFTIWVVLILSIFVYRDYSLLKYFITDG